MTLFGGCYYCCNAKRKQKPKQTWVMWIIIKWPKRYFVSLTDSRRFKTFSLISRFVTDSVISAKKVGNDFNDALSHGIPFKFLLVVQSEYFNIIIIVIMLFVPFVILIINNVLVVMQFCLLITNEHRIHILVCMLQTYLLGTRCFKSSTFLK